MKLLKILTEDTEIVNIASDTAFAGFRELVSALKDRGGVVVGSGDYGVVLELGDKAYKITTDEVELEHAQLLKGKKTKYFVHVFDVALKNPKLGIIAMENLNPLSASDEVSESFIEKLEAEAESLGIDPEELDIRIQGDKIKRDNFMKDPKTGSLKMVDV